MFWNFRPVTYQTSLFDDGYGYFFSLFFSWGRDSRGEGDEVIVVFTFIAIKFLVYIRNYHLLISKTVVTLTWECKLAT